MKKFSLLAIVSVVSVMAMAQNQQLVTPMSVKTRIGLKAGVNLAEYHVNDAPTGQNNYNVENKTSMFGGAFVNIPVTNCFRIQPEVLYSGQGSKTSFKLTGTNTTTSVEQDLHYINVPIMLQLQSTKGFYVEAGPQFGYLISAKNDGDAPYNNDIKDYFDKFDFAVAGGVGYLSRVGLGIDARYNFGLSDIVDDSYAAGGKLRNRVIQIGLFYQIGAGK